MLTKEEYQRTFIRMIGSLKDDDEEIGKANCRDVDCERCPIYKLDEDRSNSTCFNVAYSAMDLIEFVEQWGKEHPVMTNKEKYKEIFGVYPCVSFDCPPIQCPKAIKPAVTSSTCSECRSKNWGAEYIPPKEEE